MDLITLLDIANPKNIKETLNKIVREHEEFTTQVSDMLMRADSSLTEGQTVLTQLQEKWHFVEDAYAYANQAQSMANNAQVLATTAQDNANTALQTAQVAASSAQSASDNAQAALSTAQNASATATDAQANADSALALAQASSNRVDNLEQLVQDAGTHVSVAGILQSEIAFTSDPQEQLDKKINKKQGYSYDNFLVLPEYAQYAALGVTTNTHAVDIPPAAPADSATLGFYVAYDGTTKIKWLLDENDTPLLDFSGATSIKTTRVLTAPKFSQSDSSKDWVDLDAGGNSFGVAGSNATVYRLNRMLATDITKLVPTTANGWTLGASNLQLPNQGIYLIVVQLDAVNVATGIAFTDTERSTLILVATGAPFTAVYSIIYDPSQGWYAVESGRTVSIQSVAYKKLV